LEKQYFGIHVPFIAHLGVEAKEISQGEVEAELVLQPHHLNPMGVSHGGILMTLLDFTMAMSAKSKAQHAGAGLTIDMSIAFMKGGKTKLIARGKVLRSGRSIHFCEATVTDVTGELVAKAMGTFKLVEVSAEK
jgi:uncharacterized protein (TIGR00369 family)